MMKAETRKSEKLVVVGDSMVGKTCLIYAFKDNHFIPSHSPTIFETYTREIELEGKSVSKYYLSLNASLY